jgi:putative ABC transport system ATP-binding protein
MVQNVSHEDSTPVHDGVTPLAEPLSGIGLPAGRTAKPEPTTVNGRRVLIRTVNLQKVYRQKEVETVALGGIDMEIYDGEFIAVMGPSGSGKSTFFNMIGALDSPSEGRVFIDEVDAAQLTAVELAFVRCRKIGYIFQQYNLIQYMTALENVTTPMTFAGSNPDEARDYGMELLELVGLKERWFHRPIEMSGGQQQRVAIARALANKPRILLCDEPTANLDFKTGQEILEILQKLNKDKGVTIICATHDHRMLNICDRLIWIRDGLLDKVKRRDEVKIELGSVGGEE